MRRRKEPDPDDSEDEQAEAPKKRQKKRKAEEENYKSAQFVRAVSFTSVFGSSPFLLSQIEDSDEEENEERDRIFFAAEQAVGYGFICFFSCS